jgi:flagellar biogenesis protein FliO
MRRTLRPSSQQTLVAVTFVLAFVVWVCWEVGRLPWLRVLALAASTTTLLLFAAGWLNSEG